MDRTFSSTALGVISEGFRDKFLTVCSGALMLSFFYVLNRDVVDSYIIRVDYPQFTYIATVVALLGATFMMNLLHVMIRSLKAAFETYYWQYGKLKKLLKRLNSKEVTILYESTMKRTDYDNSKNTSIDHLFRITSRDEVHNLIVSGNIYNFRKVNDSNGDFYMFTVKDVIPQNDYGKGFDLIEKELSKRKRQEENKKGA